MNHGFHVFMPDFLASLHVCALNCIYNHIYIYINAYVCMTDTILLDTISGPTGTVNPSPQGKELPLSLLGFRALQQAC